MLLKSKWFKCRIEDAGFQWLNYTRQLYEKGTPTDPVSDDSLALQFWLLLKYIICRQMIKSPMNEKVFKMLVGCIIIVP